MSAKTDPAAATAAHERIIDAALTLFAERGYARTTVSSIAAAAGFSKGGIYHHFPEGKEEILFHLIERECGGITNQAREALGAAKQPIEEMTRLGEAVLFQNEWLARAGAVINSIIFGEPSNLRERVAARERENYRAYQALLMEQLRVILGGRVPAGMSPRGLSAALIGLMDGLFLQRRLGVELASREEIVAALRGLLTLLLGGPAPAGETPAGEKTHGPK